MKKLLLAGVASFALVGVAAAADLPAKAPMLKAPPAPVYDWTGFYIGGNFSTAIAQSKASTSTQLGVTELNKWGLSAAAQGGYNWQVSPNWFVGVEGEVGYLGTDRSFQQWNDPTVTVGAKTNWYGTARLRTGYVTGPSLLYVTGGAAFVGIKETFGNVNFPGNNSVTKTGWTAGAGIETKLSHNWSTSIEYLYIDAGNSSYIASPGQTATFDHQYHLLKTAVNYKFGGPSEPLPFFGAPLLSPMRDWSGFYAGVNAGGGIGLSRVNGGPNIFGSTDLNGGGFAGGVQAGYNWMVTQKWFVGVEGDVGYLGINHSYADWNDASRTMSQKTDWYGTARGRIGTTTGPALLYMTGGGAWVRVRDGISLSSGAADVTTRTAGGWTYGGGTEVALDARWSAKLEYLYMDVGKSQHSVAGFDGQFKDRFQVIRAGLNYKFGGSDVVTARY